MTTNVNQIPSAVAGVESQYPAPRGVITAGAPARDRRRYLDLSALRWPELTLCVAGPILLATLFLVPWFSTTGHASIHGHQGSVTGWQTYSVLRYFLLWCGVGAFILPWMVARRHQIGWRRGEMTAVHGMIGFVLLVLNGIGFRPGDLGEDVHLQLGYFIALALMVVYVIAGVSSADRYAPVPPKPPGVV